MIDARDPWGFGLAILGACLALWALWAVGRWRDGD